MHEMEQVKHALQTQLLEMTATKKTMENTEMEAALLQHDNL